MSLIAKPGGSFSHESGASFGVKSSAPPYIIDGLEQSHWDMANAVVSSGRVTSVPDSSNVQALTVATGVLNPAAPFYEATGWSLNGKTLPTASFYKISGGTTYYPVLQANSWATKIAGSTGAWTAACLVQPRLRAGLSFSEASAFGFGTMSWNDSQPGPFTYDSATAWTTGRNGTYAKFSPSYSTDHQLWVFQYDMQSATPLNQWKLWINGTLQTASQSPLGGWGPGNAPAYGRVAISPTKFFVGAASGNNSAPMTLDCQIAQMHIWKGALTTEQRDSITAYLKSISGIA